MDAALNKYLKRHVDLEAYPLEWLDSAKPAPELVVVIPVLAEYPGILATLGDLAQNDPAWRTKTLVIAVVNNRNPAQTPPEDIENNKQCMSALRDWAAKGHGLSLALIDAASPGRELGVKEGVGHARKMGMDWGAKLLGESGLWDAPLVCLDADTRVQGNYLATIGDFFAKQLRWGVVLDYDHPKVAGETVTPAITAYELYLRYCELGLVYAGSPYAYHAIGSAMACSVRAYLAAGGMKRRAAAEDFYFLQALTKTGVVEHLWETRVRPSARTSHRAPIGTGRHVADFLSGHKDADFVYHPDSYRILRNWMAAVEAGILAGESTLAQPEAPALQRFLESASLNTAWGEIAARVSSPQQRLQQFHVWFDALRTLRAIHHLRDNGLGRIHTFDAIQMLLGYVQEDMPGVCGSVIVELHGMLEKLQGTSDARCVELLDAMRQLTRALSGIAGVANKGVVR